MTELLLFIVSLTVIYYFTFGARLGRLSIVSLFIYAQAAMAAGTLTSLDPMASSDRTHAVLLVVTYCIVVLVASVGAILSPASARHSEEPMTIDYNMPVKSTVLWICASIGASMAYFVSVGYIAFFESLEAVLRGSDADIASLRLESYAGNSYFFPGYVNQFKNALLPALTVATVISLYHSKSHWRHPVAATLAPVTLILLLGTGQRAPFILALGLALVVTYLIAPKRLARRAAPIVCVGLLLFFLTTFASGRVALELREAEGPEEHLAILWNQLLFRIFGSNQISSIAGFRYVYDGRIPLGSEWAEGLVGLLPGKSGSDLSNKVFESLYGSTRGTAPLSIWGSAYHNLGFYGAIAFAAFLALALTSIAIKVNKKEASNLIEVVGIAGVMVTLGTWIADGPTAVLNGGFATYTVLWLWGSHLHKRRAVSTGGRQENEANLGCPSVRI